MLKLDRLYLKIEFEKTEKFASESYLKILIIDLIFLNNFIIFIL